MWKNGLLAGKFSPLHRGHERFIEQARGLCDRLTVLSWSLPEYAGCDAAQRERWFADRFPDLEFHAVTAERVQSWRDKGTPVPHLPANGDPDGVQRAFVAAWCEHVVHLPVDVVFANEGYGEGFAQDLARRLKRPILHSALDLDRAQVPVSGTLIRRDVHAHSNYLHPSVYASFVERIALLGGESTGKSSLARALAQRLDTLHVPEYGREHWEVCEGALVFDDMRVIAERQVRWEEERAPESRRYLVCDTTPLVTLFYSLDLFGRADPKLERLAERHYPHVFLCADDFDFVQDGTRRDASFRARQNRWYRDQLALREVDYHVLEGPPAQRVQQVMAVLQRSAGS